MSGARRVGAVVFDLDDTLIDWWGSIRRCLAEICDDRETAALLEHCRNTLWLTAPDGSHIWHRNTWAMHYHCDREFAAALPWLDDEERRLLTAKFNDELWVGFFPDTVATLDALVDTVPMAVMSNNHLVHEEAARLRLGDWFEVVMAAPSDALKPEPAPFLAVCEAMRVEPSEAIYVGDSIKSDVFGALRAGMVPVWHDRWSDPWPDPPTGVHRVSTISELPALLQSLR